MSLCLSADLSDVIEEKKHTATSRCNGLLPGTAESDGRLVKPSKQQSGSETLESVDNSRLTGRLEGDDKQWTSSTSGHSKPVSPGAEKSFIGPSMDSLRVGSCVDSSFVSNTCVIETDSSRVGSRDTDSRSRTTSNDVAGNRSTESKSRTADGDVGGSNSACGRSRLTVGDETSSHIASNDCLLSEMST